MKTNKFIFIGILTIILSIILIIFLKNTNKSVNKGIINRDWKTFNNQVYTFKYPADLVNIEDKSEIDVVNIYPKDSKEYLELWIRAKDKNSAFLEKQKQLDIYKFQPWGAKYVGKTKTDGYETLVYWTSTPKYTAGPPEGLSDTTPYKVYFVYTENSIYRVDYYSNNNSELFEKIISTLEFSK